jgi:hypothetical protein
MFPSVLGRFRSARTSRSPIVPPHVALTRSQLEPMEPRLLMSGSMPFEVWQALDLPVSSLLTVVADPHPDSLAYRESVKQGGLLGFPSGPDKDFLILSTGVASQVDTIGNIGGGQGTDLGNPGVTNDVQGFEFSMDVEGGAAGRKFKFDFMFLSEEYPEFVNMGFNDFFHAYIDFDGPEGDAPVNSTLSMLMLLPF